MEFIPSGDSAVFCSFGNSIDETISESIIDLHLALRASGIKGYVESVPSYTGLMVYYNNASTTLAEIRGKISGHLHKLQENLHRNEKTVIYVPVSYGGAYGPDLVYIAKEKGLPEEEFIRIHSEKPYRIYMLGFTPGFPYLGGMDKRIAFPRKETPVLKIKAGSVGIAGDQTGIYPLESPGGWQIIGKTPLRLFDFSQKEPFLFSAGSYIKFEAVSLDEYFNIAEDLRSGHYSVRKEIME